ncbi:hypothetical protein A7D33_07810 [Candidatus Methylacidiphilum fumarolicum]|nr:hypothetical protein A7D33_07810 [Candidatus Methylacidiphilum fumarolicum]
MNQSLSKCLVSIQTECEVEQSILNGDRVGIDMGIGLFFYEVSDAVGSSAVGTCRKDSETAQSQA